MIRRLLGALADGLLSLQTRYIPITSWMPRFYRVQNLIDWQAQHTLDASCGTGELTLWMARKGLRTAGVNISEHEIEVARHRAQEANVPIDFRVGDLTTKTPFPDGAFDQIISLGTVVHIPDDDKAFEEFWRLLAPGGRLLISLAAHAPSGIGGLFSGEGFIRKITPQCLRESSQQNPISWLDMSAKKRQARFFQHRFYQPDQLRSQLEPLFELKQYQYVLHLFSSWVTDLVFGVRFCRFLEPLLFFLGARLDRCFFSPRRPGYLLFAILQKASIEDQDK